MRLDLFGYIADFLRQPPPHSNVMLYPDQLGSPLIETQPRVEREQVVSGPGSSLSLSCLVEGNPQPALQWYFADAKVGNSFRHLFWGDVRLIVTVAYRCGPHTCWGSRWEGWRGSTPSPSPRPRWPRLETTPVSQKTALAPSKSTLRWILVGFNICGGYNKVWQVHGRPTEATFERAGSKSGHRSFQLSWKVWCLLTHIFRLSVFLGFRVIIVFFWA